VYTLRTFYTMTPVLSNWRWEGEGGNGERRMEGGGGVGVGGAGECGGGEVAVVQDLLGHASPATTRVYAKVSSRWLREAHREIFGYAGRRGEEE